jgi:hypothetical protein
MRVADVERHNDDLLRHFVDAFPAFDDMLIDVDADEDVDSTEIGVALLNDRTQYEDHHRQILL